MDALAIRALPLELVEPPRGLGLTMPELDDAIAAVIDRADVAGPDECARLGRVRRMLEAELGRLAAI